MSGGKIFALPLGVDTYPLGAHPLAVAPGMRLSTLGASPGELVWWTQRQQWLLGFAGHDPRQGRLGMPLHARIE